MITKFHYNMEYELKIRLIRHKEITPEDVDKIIKLKSQHWNYSYESQYKWLYENIADNDFHLILENSKHKLIAYLNIVYVDVECDGKSISHLGIGNVCVAKELKGMGYGILLMNIATYYIKLLNKTGILICKENLREFYKKTGWIEFKKNWTIGDITIKGILFISERRNYTLLKINKNF